VERNIDDEPVDEGDEPEYVERDTVHCELAETGPHTGIFVGAVVPRPIAADSDAIRGDDVLSARQGDDITLAYTDETHMGAEGARELGAQARILVGNIQDVRIEHRVVQTLDIKAQKDVIEARLYLRLGEVFKEVGLSDKADEKADEGLERVQSVISTAAKASLDRELVEEAYSIKWELLLVQGKLREAINACNALMRLFPDSSLVDNALFKIGEARVEEGKLREAIQVFEAVTRLAASDLKADARFRIAETVEADARERAVASGRDPDLSRAMTQYLKCSDDYPDSPFAGAALGKIADYYLSTKDYVRVNELMERVFQDYPDASFLDEMLLKWAMASYRTGNLTGAQQKLKQLVDEYPTISHVTRAG